MSSAYTISKRADQDIKNITLRSLTEFGENQTNKYMADMKAALEAIADTTSLGRPFTHKKTIRKYLFYRYVSHVVYFRLRKDNIFIVRILHTKMLPENHI